MGGTGLLVSGYPHFQHMRTGVASLSLNPSGPAAPAGQFEPQQFHQRQLSSCLFKLQATLCAGAAWSCAQAVALSSDVWFLQRLPCGGRDVLDLVPHLRAGDAWIHQGAEGSS